MTSRRLRLEILSDLERLKGLQLGSEDFEKLVSGGVNPDALTKYVGDGRGRKSRGAAHRPSKRIVEELVDRGGHVAGGSALNEWLFMEASGSDVDVFFSDFPSFVAAHLDTYDNLSVEICLFRDRPYELFDLDASKCSRSASGFDVDTACEEALSSGVSSVCLENVVDATATLWRVRKYGSRYGLRFRPEQILFLASAFKVRDPDAVHEALQHSAVSVVNHLNG